MWKYRRVGVLLSYLRSDDEPFSIVKEHAKAKPILHLRSVPFLDQWATSRASSLQATSRRSTYFVIKEKKIEMIEIHVRDWRFAI